MKEIAVVEKKNNTILLWYEDEAPNRRRWGGLLGNSKYVEHLELPEGTDSECVVAQENDNGELELVEDSDLVAQKKQKVRDEKLTKLRELRQPKLDRADDELKKHQDSDETAVGTYSAWQNYRKALRRITDDFKRSSDSTKGKAALDSYKADMSDFDGWPQEPS